ncbi:MAG: undecaprenyl-diphosphooligosaccharide--protein glycosyltransferase [Myxococcota bacterium]|jgi:undecaprenyl-diphosphooligosaccharide--protein glycosyltransferase
MHTWLQNHLPMAASPDRPMGTSDPVGRWQLAALMLVAWGIGLFLRLLWVPEAFALEQALVDGVPMPTTGDSYVWGASIRAALEGFGESTARLPAWDRQAVTALGVLVTKVTPWSLTEVLLYLPIVVGSLLVVPVILTGRLLGSTWFGFFAALLAVSATSYVSRTSFGYYDTDMFAVTFQAAVLLTLLGTALRRSLEWALMAALLLTTYRFIYDKGGFVAMTQLGAYALLVGTWMRGDPRAPALLALVALAFLPIPHILRPIPILAAYLLFKRWRFPQWRWMLVGGAALVALMLLTGTGRQILQLLGRFLGADAAGDLLYTFVGERLIAETQGASFPALGARISGHWTLMLVAIAGYGLACWRWRPLLMGIPLWLLGLSAMWTGMRFTIYAVPVAAIGSVAAMYVVAAWLPRVRLRGTAVAAMVTAALIPAIIFAESFGARVNLDRRDVVGMKALGEVAGPNDFAVTWWDFGYPLAYYAGVSSIVDGGHHSRDSALIARAFSSRSPILAANLSRMMAETAAKLEGRGKHVLGRAFRRQSEGRSANEFLAHMATPDYTPPQKEREVFLYMPLRMLPLLATVYRYAAVDLETGKEAPSPMFVFAMNVDREQARIKLVNDFVIDPKAGMLIYDPEESHLRQSFKIRTLMRITPANNGPHKVVSDTLHADGAVTVIWLEIFKAMLVVDDALLYSNVVQMMLLDRWDNSLFEPVIRNPQLRAYRLRK